ncbi:Reverse transcriptase-RNase H-integrase [Mycena kentingensis (nom. inval.)]|nr:Reverse transcriptase-RNase H-integrase [Mycena kentingensis (nom. inval.)]
MDAPAAIEAKLVRGAHNKSMFEVTNGRFTASLIRDILEAGNAYIRANKVPADEATETLIPAFKGAKARSWFRKMNENDALVGMPWPQMMDLFREKMLGEGWETELVRDVITASQGKSEPFDDYIVRVTDLNELLHGRPSHLAPPALRIHIHSRLLPKLAALYDDDAKRLNAIVDFDEWTDAIAELDRKRIVDSDRRQRDVREFIAAERRNDNKGKRPRVSDGTTDTRDAKRSRNPAGSAPSSSSAPGGSNHLTRLDEDQKGHLDDNFGCRKCRRLFVFHKSFDNAPGCTFPKPEDVVVITDAVVKQARANLTPAQRTQLAEAEAAAKAKKATKKAAPVAYAAVADSDSDSESSSDDSSSIGARPGGLLRPGPVVSPDGQTEEYLVERIIDERTRYGKRQFRVRWFGYGPEHDDWLPLAEVNDLAVFDAWKNGLSQTGIADSNILEQQDRLIPTTPTTTEDSTSIISLSTRRRGKRVADVPASTRTLRPRGKDGWVLATSAA